MIFRQSQSALFERLLKEKDQQIKILAEQIDYLRVLLAERGVAPLSTALRPLNPADQPPAVMGVPPYLSDEEEDLLALHESGRISDAQLKQLREDLDLPELQLG